MGPDLMENEFGGNPMMTTSGNTLVYRGIMVVYTVTPTPPNQPGRPPPAAVWMARIDPKGNQNRQFFSGPTAAEAMDPAKHAIDLFLREPPAPGSTLRGGGCRRTIR
jgi:hypothetical protein